MAAHVYRVREGKDNGFGRFHLYCDGDWLQSFTTQELADDEVVERQKFDATRSEIHQ